MGQPSSDSAAHTAPRCEKCGGPKPSELLTCSLDKCPYTPSAAQDRRQSIQPTYDHRETGDRFTVETRINGRRLNEVVPTRDPFIHHRVVIGWRDLLRFVTRGREVVVIVGGDPEIVDDVIELDADALTLNSTRRDEWDATVEGALRRV